MTILIIIAVIVLLYKHDKFVERIINEWYEGEGND